MATPQPSAEAAARKLGLGQLQRHLFLCVRGGACCEEAESIAVWEYVKKRMKELGLVGDHPIAHRSPVRCLRICAEGPIAVVYPEGAWYKRVTVENAERIIQEHLINGRVVEDLCFARDPLGGLRRT
jgi:(2Fe-2S) ferredoxin